MTFREKCMRGSVILFLLLLLFLKEMFVSSQSNTFRKMYLLNKS